MASRTPKTVAEARRLLEDADVRTRDGREQIVRIAAWAEGRSIPDDLQAEITERQAEAGQNRGVRREREVGRTTASGNAAWGARYAGQAAAGTESPTSAGSDDIDEYVSGVLGEGGVPQDILGIPEGDVWSRSRRDPRMRSIPVGPTSGDLYPEGPPEPYYDGTELALLRGMNAEQRARLQDVLVATGLATGIIPGELDDATVNGFSKLLGMANRRGERWSTTIGRLQARVDSGELGPAGSGGAAQPDPGFLAQTYLPPDPAEIRGSIRDIASKLVPDIDLSDDEVDFLRGQFERIGRSEFEEAEGLRREQFDASLTAAGGEDATASAVPSAGEVAGATASRFEEVFRERYQSSIDQREDVDQEVARREVTGSNLGRLMQIATGRGR